MQFLRYPGGKVKLIYFIEKHLPMRDEIESNYIEPFVGGGSVFLKLKPKKAILADINSNLIELYSGIKKFPEEVWNTYVSFPEGKDTYYYIRDSDYKHKHLSYRAARTLYLNRTCFKGMWRHSSKGNFNIGYGGEERRKNITKENILDISKILKKTKLIVCDFEILLKQVNDGDFIFLDPPYKPGKKELNENHYDFCKFNFADQIRMSKILKSISNTKNVKWIMTNSDHKDIRALYKNFKIEKIPKGVSNQIGIHTFDSKEILISNL